LLTKITVEDIQEAIKELTRRKALGLPTSNRFEITAQDINDACKQICRCT